MLVFSGVSVKAIRDRNKQIFDTTNAMGDPQNFGNGIINITVYEAWELLTNTSNGIQIPIDVRTDEEWNEGFIDTPYPECPIHYCLDLLKENETLQEFLDLYSGEEVILYCKGGYRSTIAAYILYYANFTGTIYNMLGGITAWIDAELPIRGDNQPNAPIINGPQRVKKGTEVKFTFNSTDPDGDVIYYNISWGDNTTTQTDPYNVSGEEVTVIHSWNEKGTYNIKATAIDFYFNESAEGSIEIRVPKNKNILYQGWLERFPRLQKILDVLRVNSR